MSELKGTCVPERNGEGKINDGGQGVKRVAKSGKERMREYRQRKKDRILQTCSNERYEDQVESTETEQWEEEINPLGLLDLVYVDDEEANEVPLNETQTTSLISTKANIIEEQKPTSDNSADTDEGDELEPVAVVDVLPGREEDFLPEGLTQEFMEPSRNSRTTCWVSNAGLADQQWNLQKNQLIDRESILQHVLEIPRQMWPLQMQPSVSQSTPQVTWKLAKEVNFSPNHLLEPVQHTSIKQSLEQRPELPNEIQRKIYHEYSHNDPELMRIRNREYARRYRQANPELVRERQRAYIKRYRERKRLEKEQAGLFGTRREESEIIVLSDENRLNSGIFLGKNNSEKKMIVQNMPAAIKSKNSESNHILDTNFNNEVMMLS